MSVCGDTVTPNYKVPSEELLLSFTGVVGKTKRCLKK